MQLTEIKVPPFQSFRGKLGSLFKQSSLLLYSLAYYYIANNNNVDK